MTRRHGLDPADVAVTPTRTLLRVYAATLTELVRRGVVRTRNAPAGDLAELLVARAYAGELAPNSEKSWDVRADDGRLLQVKCRVVSERPSRGQLGLSPFRSFDFDAAVIVLLAEATYDVVQAVELPVGAVKESSRLVRHVNGHRLLATPALLTGRARSTSPNESGLLSRRWTTMCLARRTIASPERSLRADVADGGAG
jgi:hypothetical protein